MITLRFNIPLYDFDVCLVQLERSDNEKEITKVFKWLKIDDDDIKNVINALKRGAHNGGDTWRNFELHKILVSFYPTKSRKQRATLYSHEKRHIEDRGLEWASVDDIESAGMLAGFIGDKFDIFTNMVRKKLCLTT